MVTISEVPKKFFATSLCMLALPLAILYGFHHNWYTGLAEMPPHSRTLLSGFLAVISVNVALAFYVFMALREPSDKHNPDPTFVEKAKASLDQLKSGVEGSSVSSPSQLFHGKKE